MVSSLWILFLTSSQISVKLRLQSLKTAIQANKMMFGSKSCTAASFLILVMNFFRGHTLPCHRSEYQIGNECCPMCPVGSRVKTDCSEIRSTSCLPCAEESYMNLPTGRKLCFPCRTCGAGSGLKIKTSCTTMSDTVCEPLEGYYCMESTDGSCMLAQEHTSCQPGQYISQKGTAFRDTVCSDCSDGTYSNGTFSSCQPHKQCEEMNLQLMRPGTASTDAECGEKSPKDTGIVIGLVVVGLLFLVIASVVAWWYLRKRKGCPNIGGEKANPENSKQENLNGDTPEMSHMLER